MANRAAKRAADIIKVAAQHGSTLEEAAVYVDEFRVRGLARLAQARLQLQASEAAAHQAEVEAAAAEFEATEADAAALDELQAALDAALEAAGRIPASAAGFVLQSDNTTRQFRYTMEDAANSEVAASNATAAEAAAAEEMHSLMHSASAEDAEKAEEAV